MSPAEKYVISYQNQREKLKQRLVEKFKDLSIELERNESESMLSDLNLKDLIKWSNKKCFLDILLSK